MTLSTNTLPLPLRLAVEMPWPIKRKILTNPHVWRFFAGGCRRLGWGDNCLGWYEARNGPYAGIRLNARHRNHLWVPMGGFEPEISDTIAGLIEPGKPAWDVGANVGIVALLMANHRASEVVAFEPDPVNYSLLLDQLQANPQLSPRVQPRQVAVSNYCGEVSFVSRGASESHIASPEESNGKAIQCVTLDSILEEMPGPAFVKMDVEGAEVSVLEGAAKLLSEWRPTFLIEVHSREVRRVLENIKLRSIRRPLSGLER